VLQPFIVRRENAMRSALRSSASTGELAGLVDGALTIPGASATVHPFLGELVSAPERGVRAVLLYGSCLWPSVQGRASCPDLMVIVDSLTRFHRSVAAALLGAVLPPSVYRLGRGMDAYAKLSIATVDQLKSQCAVTAKDLHLAGRLSKRVALVWARDAESRALVVEAQVAALRTLAPLALSRLGRRVAVDHFIEALLRLSYESEIRIVEPAKVAALFAVEREHYRAIARALLADLGARPDGETGALIVPPSAVAAPALLARRLRRSRRRALMRWPKYLITYDGWLDYLLKKLERTGEPVALTEWQRRLPLVLALPVLFRLATARRLA
jgi:hypothetical protein